MAATSKFRAEYDQLQQIAKTFGSQAEGIKRMFQSLSRQKQVLEGGQWRGKGSAKFYGEMNSTVLPSVKRLSDALTKAQQVTLQISRIIKEAENAAAAVFKATGSGSAAPARPGGGFWGGVKDFFGGMWDEAKDMVGGLWHMVKDPIGTAKALWHGITHPGELWDAFKKPYVEAWESGHPWRAVGRGVLFAASFLIGAKGADKVGKAGEIGKAAEVAKAGRAAELAELAKIAKAGESAGAVAKFADTLEAAKALRVARTADEAAEIAQYIARQSTHVQEPATRVVLGKWVEQDGKLLGYVGEAKANGGIWYQTEAGFYEAVGKDANLAWKTNEAFLQQQLANGVPRLEFHGFDVAGELAANAGKSFDQLPARLKEFYWLKDNAGKFGYVQDGTSFVKAAGGSSTLGTVGAGLGQAGVAGEVVSSATRE